MVSCIIMVKWLVICYEWLLPEAVCLFVDGYDKKKKKPRHKS